MRLLAAAAALLLCMSLESCDSVKFYQKEKLGRAEMSFAESPTQSTFRAKTIYSREGSVGGIGETAGGGCGCH